MKTKTLLLIFLFAGMAILQLSAQNGKNGTGIYKETDILTEYNGVPAFCGGQLIDLVSGTLKDHFTSLYQNGVLIWCKAQIIGDAVSSTGETFKVKSINKVDDLLENGIVHVNYVGNAGTHFIGYFQLVDYNTWDLKPIKIACPGE